MFEKARTETTYRREMWRAVTAGIIETAGTTFLLLIAVRWYAAGPISKGLLAASGSIGLLLSPWMVSYAVKGGWPISHAAARILAAGGLCFLMPALVPALPVYVAGCVVAMAASAAIVPLLTQMYQENYPDSDRGRRFSRTVMIRIAAAALFSQAGGLLLSRDIGQFRAVLLVFAAAMGGAAVALWGCPTRPLAAEGSRHPLRGMRFVREDPVFRRTLICWMLMGFANLMMLPLRVEYLANERYGFALSTASVALLTGVIPNLARIVMSPVWGHLFDRMNFFSLRVTLNLGFMLGILAFFTSNSFSGMIVGALVFGISGAGGDVAWSLWVTKFAPPGRVADYMAVHTFFTGVRGVVAPLLAFYIVGAQHQSLGVLAGVSAGMIGLATVLLLPELPVGRKAKPAAALVEEVSD